MKLGFFQTRVRTAHSYNRNNARRPKSDRKPPERCRSAFRYWNVPAATLTVLSIAMLRPMTSIGHAQTYTESVLYAPQSVSDGINLFAPVIQASDGNFYSVATANNSTGSTIFEVSPSGQSALIYNFPSIVDQTRIGLTEGSDGNLYGVLTTGWPGTTPTYDFGVIFKISLPSGTESTLYTFCTSQQANGDCVGGFQPDGVLVEGSDGNFYGTTVAGGSGTYGAGTIFKITPAGTLTTLYNFCSQGGSTCSDGYGPEAGLVQGSDGNFYGATTWGGSACPDNTSTVPGCGVIYELTPSGTYSVIYSFTGGSTGAFPDSRLVEGADGSFYGTTQAAYAGPGQPPTPGIVFKVTTSGTLTPLYSPSANVPEDGLVLGSDGNLYGTDYSGGSGEGSIYQLTPAGAATVIYSFLNTPDGANPDAQPMQGSDGNLYGTTLYGGNSLDNGTYDSGVVWKLAVSPSLQPPVSLTLSEQTTQPGQSVTLNWSVANAYSMTLQQCYAFIQGGPNGAGSWTGLQTGTFNAASDPPYSGSAMITPSADGVYTYALTCGGMESGFATLIVGAAPTLAVTTTSLPAGQVGAAYAQTLQASGGVSPYTWSISSGSLPAGILLSPTGIISGTPTTAGASSFSVEVKDSESIPQTSTANLGITISPAPLTVSTASLPSGSVGVAYSQTLQATGGVAPYTWSTTSGTLPTGMSLSSSGVISGTPTSAATFVFTVQAKDSESTPQTAKAGLSIVVNSTTLAISTPSLPGATVGTAYSQTLQATGGISPYTWSLSAGSLPTGLTLAATGAISGTPSSAGTANFTVEVKDSESTPQTATENLSVTVNPVSLSIITTSLPSGTVGTPYSQSLEASGGVPPYSYTLASGSLPTPLQLNASTGVIAGTPTTPGASSFSITVKDSETPAASVSAPLSITVMGVTPSVSMTAQPNTGLTYGQAITLTATESPVEGLAQGYSWTISEDGGSLVTGALSNGSGSYTMTTTPHAGQHTFTAIYSSTQNFYPTGTSNTVSLTVAEATPSVSAWPTASAITYGQTLASSTLSGGTASTAGAFTWTTSATAPGAGTASEGVTFTPADAADYNTVTGTVMVTVNKATPTVTVWPTASAITAGQTLSSSTLTGGSASVGGAFAWTTPSTVPAVGNYSGSVTFTPTDSTDYNTVTGKVIVTVNAAAGFALASSPMSVSVSQGGTGTSTITVTSVGGFSGIVALSTTGLPSGVTSSFAAGSAAGTQVLTLTASASAPVTSTPVTVTVTGTSGALSATTSISLSITPQPSFTAGSGGTTSISIAPGATTGNTGTISIAGTNGFAGTVNLSCKVTTSITNANDIPSCSLNPVSVTISGTAAQTSILAVTTTAASSAENNIKKLIWPTGGTTLALVVLFMVPRRRRSWLAMSGMLLLSAAIGVVGCGGGSGGGGQGGGGGNSGTTAGGYTITVTGTSGIVSAIVGTVNVTVQ